MHTTQAGHTITKTMVFHNYYSCAGTIAANYSVCFHDGQYICFNPIYHSQEQWIDVKASPVLGSLLIAPG
jgi:hypothetical protein